MCNIAEKGCMLLLLGSEPVWSSIYRVHHEFKQPIRREFLAELILRRHRPDQRLVLEEALPLYNPPYTPPPPPKKKKKNLTQQTINPFLSLFIYFFFYFFLPNKPHTSSKPFLFSQQLIYTIILSHNTTNQNITLKTLPR